MLFVEVVIHKTAKSRVLKTISHLSDQSVGIRILATTDLHMNLCSFDYYADQDEPTIGLTRTASLIRQARNEAEADGDIVLLFDNGDALQGTPLGDWAADPANAPHILMQAFGSLGYDAIGLGNHDFGFGLHFLQHVISDAPCPVLSSNALRTNGPQIWQDHVILHKEIPGAPTPMALKIGVFSVLPPQTAQWEAHKLHDTLTTQDILTCAANKVRKLKDENCDLIIALAHTGFGPDRSQRNMENAIIPLAEIEGIDAIIAGHSHLTYPVKAGSENTLVHGKPVVLPGTAGSHLGVIDLKLHSAERGGWTVGEARAALRPISAGRPDEMVSLAPEDPELLHLFSSGHAETRRRAGQPVGRTPHHLHSYFSFCAEDRGLRLVAAAQAAALRLCMSDTDLADIPILSAVSPSKFGGRAGPRFYTDVKPGEIFLRNVVDLHVFPNELQGVIVSGDQIVDWLEMSAAVFNQISTGSASELICENRVGHNFDVLYGLSCRIDLTQPPRFDDMGTLINAENRRVSEVLVGATPIAPDQQFAVALNNYRASGGGHFPFAGNAQRIDMPILPVQQALLDYLSGTLVSDPLEEAQKPFRITSNTGTQAILRTGPNAHRLLQDIQEFDPQVLGTDENGFLRILLTF
ncbi:2',3'-cyclic-nucleotide 2'-phosphodiesterase / 3'-nucleotidase [Ruegeria faecimaris]|uniref:2',3'-cyclic-nucleotide 2'-phosphodiesterase / 3'-nucleotidase n=1 Tax=Ruegeria faecimaris TaxID=686389 RepID=A0A521D846_9RHOB|nr:2',3'-cyclic-nucleotide 2'-phosphodiesterase / 3'-nucleotidase [Ruegeria faecimaris]